MAQIEINQLTFCYAGSYDNVFENVSFRLDTSWRLGLVGRNGRGKTTLLKLLMGEQEYRGSISAPCAFEYFPYQVEGEQELTIEVLRRLTGREDWEIIRELYKLKITEDAIYRLFGTLSNGEQTKVLLAALFLRENRFLLIDEPTNHLDIEGRNCVAEYLQGKSGFILVSHDRSFLDRCVDHIISINKANIDVRQCNFSVWYENKVRSDCYELSQNERLSADIKRLSASAKQAKEWSDKTEKSKNVRNSGLRQDKGFVGHKAAKMMQRATNTSRRIENAIGEKEKLLKNIEKAEELKLSPQYHRAGKLVELCDIKIAYEENSICDGVSFEISNGERVCLAGHNGCGKSSIIKLLCGERIPHEGIVTMANGLVVSYVPQSTAGMCGGLHDYSVASGIDETLFLTILRKMDFERIQFEKKIEDMSAGQKKKVLLARSLCEKAHLYIWDEPLNFIDIFSRMQIEELILQYQPTLLFVEHDAFFREKIATKTILL